MPGRLTEPFPKFSGPSSVLDREATENQGNKGENPRPNSGRLFQGSPHPCSFITFRSAAVQGQSEGGTQDPEMRPWPGSRRPTQPPPDKGRSRKEGALTKPSAAFIPIYQRSFFLLCCLPFSGPRHVAQGLIWVSLFKCPNPCQGLVSSCVHFALY